MNWPLYSLDELGSVSRGRSRHRPRDAKHLYDGPYPFVQTGDVKKAPLYLCEYTQTYSEAGLNQSRLWPKGTLCITIAANIAETAILDIDACFPDSIIGFIPDEEKADAKFIKYQFDGILKIRMQGISQGATQDNLSQQKLLSFKFYVPDITQQRELVSILSTYDDLIENNRRRIGLLEEAARLLYREWFVHFRFPGGEGMLAQNFSKKTLKEIANLTMGQSPASKFYNDTGEGLPFHQGVTDYGVRFVEDRVFSTHATKLAFPNDILVSVRAPVGRINITKNKIVLGRGLAAVNSKSGHSSFLFYALKQFFFKEDIIGTGAIYAATTKNQMEKLEFPNPPSEFKNRFDELVSPMDRQISNLVEQNKILIKARDLLLPRLMNGQIAI